MSYLCDHEQVIQYFISIHFSFCEVGKNKKYDQGGSQNHLISESILQTVKFYANGK